MAPKRVWKPVVGFEDVYEVSNDGLVKSLGGRRGAKPGRILKQGLMNSGYLKVCLRDSKSGHYSQSSVHRLVAEAFIPNPSEKPQVNHINGDKKDNRVENLEWATASENIGHSYKCLGRGAPHNKGNRKLTDKQVVEIFEASGSNAEIAAKYGISDVAVGLIKRKKTWKELLKCL